MNDRTANDNQERGPWAGDRGSGLIPPLKPIPLLAGLARPGGDDGALSRAGRVGGLARLAAVRESRLEAWQLVNVGGVVVSRWLHDRASLCRVVSDAAERFVDGLPWHDSFRPHPVVARAVRLYVYRNNCPVSLALAWRARYGFDVEPPNPPTREYPGGAPAKVRAANLFACRTLVECEILAGVRGVDGELLAEFRMVGAEGAAGVGGVGAAPVDRVSGPQYPEDFR